MFLQLDHKKLEVYKYATDLVVECYTTASVFPREELYGLSSQIKRAAVSVCLNIAEGESRRSALERKRFFEMARGSIIELDAAFEIAIKLNYVTFHDLEKLQQIIISTFRLLSKLIQSTKA